MKFLIDETAPDDTTKQHAGSQRLLWITPCLGGLILLVWTHTFGGIIAAIAWWALALALALGSFKLVKKQVHRLLPALSETENSELTCFVLVPLWIAEPLRMAVAASFPYVGNSDPMTVFRVARPDQWPANIFELITALAVGLMVKRIYTGFDQENTALGKAKIATTALIIVAVFFMTYVLTGVAALLAVASTMTFRFM